MSTVIYAPWLRISENASLGPWELVRYVREELPGGPDQEVLDRLLSICREPINDEPIPEAVLVSCKENACGGTANEDDIVALFELLGFTGLAKREFFNPLGKYVNRQNFEVRKANYKSIDSIYGVTVRKRDTIMKHGIDEKRYRIRQPLSTYGSFRDPFSIPLYTALDQAVSNSSGDAIYEAIICFNLSSTDSNMVSDDMELVNMLSAFQRLFNCWDEGLSQEMITLIEYAGAQIDHLDCSDGNARGSRIQGAQHKSEAWLKDLHRLRGGLAHGRLNSA